jgi:hypothetical protein
VSERIVPYLENPGHIPLLVGCDCSIVVGTAQALMRVSSAELHVLYIDGDFDDAQPEPERCMSAAAMAVWLLTQRMSAKIFYPLWRCHRYHRERTAPVFLQLASRNIRIILTSRWCPNPPSCFFLALDCLGLWDLGESLTSKPIQFSKNKGRVRNGLAFLFIPLRKGASRPASIRRNDEISTPPQVMMPQGRMRAGGHPPCKDFFL